MKKRFLFFPLFLIISFGIAQTETIVYFDSNKSELKPDAIKALDSLAATLLLENKYRITVNGYCDNTASDYFNLALSKNRAKIVADYLKTKIISGLDVNIEDRGLGESTPVASNEDEVGKAKNRRAEIVLEITRPLRESISTSEPITETKKTFNEKSSLTDLKVGKTLVLQNLNFEGGTAVLLPEGKPTLEMLLKTMQNNPMLVIEIGGHVCCMDDMPLSILRAEFVYKYLLKNGISKDRMTYKGYSRNKPVFEDDKDESRARANRRVEITVIKMQ